MDVVVVGSCNIDLISYATHLPKEGETITGTKFSTGFGGKGANQCVTAGKLGAKVAMVSKVGNDAFGQDYLKNLQDCNVNCGQVKVVDDVSTGVAAITVADNGSNCIIIVPGANDLLTVSDVEAAEDLIKSSKVLVCQNEIPSVISLAAMKSASNHKVKVIYNPAPAQKDFNPELFSLPDFFCPNETEAELLTGCPVESIDDAMKACRDLTENHGCNSVIITMGKNGAVYQQRRGVDPLHIPVDAVAAVDTTGAGDSFIGSLAYFLATRPELPVPEMIKRASFIASVSVTKPGTQISYPRADELPAHIFS
ncbi:ribokinase [Aplysia californica]|uniref:Ribokinase n=1 Tax=Aplysia californica TaxID=6500 RepID=A0ABM0JW74_APLCA|nr:ribokinase [Aplysia californica]